MNSLNKFYCALRLSNPHFNTLLNNVSKKAYSSADDIVIPKKIPRGPTDILRALASTVQRDPTAAHYKYHDDPYLIPMSNLAKRSFALSKESGRKSARFIRDQHSEFFQHKTADPPIEAFFPRIVYDEKSDVSEETLCKLIEEVSVSDAITVYDLLEKKEIGISDTVKRSFLELLCYYNAEDSLPEDWIEEKWFKQNLKFQERTRKTWKDGGLAEKIFKSLENKDSAAYCSLIQGMLRFYQVDRAYELYQETLDKGLHLNTETFNSLIRVNNFLRESDELRMQLLMDFLSEMVKQNLKPNVCTLNAALETVHGFSTNRSTKNFMLRLLSEFKNIGIEPSLGTYYHLLSSFCKDKGPVSHILYDIMDYIEGKSFEIQDMRDVDFFLAAMSVCRNHLHDKELAYRVDRLLHTGNNYNLIGDCFKENVYYRHFFILLCETEPIDVFMEFYNKIVPHVYTPEPSVMEEVIKAIDLNAATQYFSRIWSDIVIFGHSDRESVVTLFLAAMVSNSSSESKELCEQFAKCAWEIWEKVTEQDEYKYNRLTFTGEILGSIMTLCLRADEFDKAREVLKKLNTDAHKILGSPDVKALELFVQSCIQRKDLKNAMVCIKYCADLCFTETGDIANQLRNGMELSETEAAQLRYIVGQVAQGGKEPEQVETEAH